MDNILEICQLIMGIVHNNVKKKMLWDKLQLNVAKFHDSDGNKSH